MPVKPCQGVDGKRCGALFTPTGVIAAVAPDAARFTTSDVGVSDGCGRKHKATRARRGGRCPASCVSDFQSASAAASGRLSELTISTGFARSTPAG
jgi:hypothetical protein